MVGSPLDPLSEKGCQAARWQEVAFFLFFNNFIYLIFDRVGSSGFSLVMESRGYSLVVVLASHCRGFSCCRVQALGCLGFSRCHSWALEHRLNSFDAQA